MLLLLLLLLVVVVLVTHPLLLLQWLLQALAGFQDRTTSPQEVRKVFGCSVEAQWTDRMLGRRTKLAGSSVQELPLGTCCCLCCCNLQQTSNCCDGACE